MNVVRHKIKLVDKKEGTVHVFLSGMPQEANDFMEKAIRLYVDPESRFGFVSEPYVADVVAAKVQPKQEKREAK